MVKMGDGDILISGFLRKSPPESKFNISGWQKRYFVLHTNKQLLYFKNDKEKRPLKEPINLAFCKSVESHLAHSKFKNVFSIVTDQRTYYLVADSESEMDSWVDKLCTVCGFLRTDDNNSSDLNRAQGSNEYQTSQPHSHPIVAAKLRTMSPVGLSASVSSSGSSAMSPSSPCPLSIPKHVANDMNKARSLSDPPELSNTCSPMAHYNNHRRQSEQVGLATCPVNFQGVPYKTFSPTGVASIGNCDTLPSPRFSSQDTCENVPNRVQKIEEAQSNYDDVPLPRLVDRLASPSSPRVKCTVNHLSPRQEDYDAVPLPRPVSQGSSRCSQEVYDFVPPPRPTSSCSETQDLYDVPPSLRSEESENYDIVPPAKQISSYRDVQDGGGFSDVHVGLGNAQENYDVVPLPRPTSYTQEDYDVVPLPRPTSHAQENYDVVPLPRPTPYSDSPGGQRSYNNSSYGRAQEKENYDFVPQPRPLSSCSNTEDGSGLYDFPPGGRESEQDNYDVLPPMGRQRYLDPEKKENYDVVPRPTSQEIYDVVPPARPKRTGSESGSTPGNQSASDPRLTDAFQSNWHSGAEASYHWVPAPFQTRKDPYDTLPNTTRPVSADSGLNASFSSICSLKSDGQDDKYDAPLPPVPNEKRDSGSLSDETPEYDDRDNEGIYDKPPNLPFRDSIYDVPPKLGDSVLPTHSDDIYDVPPTASDDIYDVPPQQPNQGCLSNPRENAGVPVVDRSKKPPPQVNRAMKPKALVQDHSYSNMAPPVDRGSKHNRSNMPQPEHSYINCASLPQRPQFLPLVKPLSGNPYVGSLPSQQIRGPPVHEDLEYCLMGSAPTRSSSSRCYSFGKSERQNSPVFDQNYEDMSAIQTKRLSKNSSSSSSSLGDNDEYTHMTPAHVGSSPIQVEQRKRKDLLYAEVEIAESPHLKPHPAQVARKANTHYTFINEESTRALLQMSNARRENR